MLATLLEVNLNWVIKLVSPSAGDTTLPSEMHNPKTSEYVHGGGVPKFAFTHTWMLWSDINGPDVSVVASRGAVPLPCEAYKTVFGFHKSTLTANAFISLGEVSEPVAY